MSKSRNLRNSGLIISPDEYTNRISGFYNTIITLLLFIIGAFSFLSILHFRSISKDQVTSEVEKTLLENKKFDEILKNYIGGELDDKASEQYDRITKLENRLKELELLVKDGETDPDDEDTDGEVAEN